MQKISIQRIAVFGLLICSAVGQTAMRNVKDYGAAGDGITSDTLAINAAVAACDPNDVVYFPTGVFKSGSIVLKSHVTLELSAGATLLATGNPEYSPVTYNPWDAYQDWGHSHWESSLIWGIGLDNITITGTGLINGSAMTAGDPATYYGDRTISFKDCTGIRIENIKIYRAGHFGIITTGCSDITINNVLIDTNRDGMNIDCCDDVEITNCVVNAPGDDAICMKSSYALGYKRATENVLIDNCTVMGRAIGYLLNPPGSDEKWHAGRIKFGTESNGGFKNITITNCTFDYCRGFMLASVDGGDIDNIVISNIQMTNLFCAPIFMRLGNRASGPDSPPPGTYRNVTFTDITAGFNTTFNGNISSIVSGIPGHKIEDIRFINVNTTYPGGGPASWASLVLGENEAGSPDVFMFGTATPSYGFYLRHVDGVEFHGCSFDFSANDWRPSFVLIDAKTITLDSTYAERYWRNDTFVLFEDDVDDLTIQNSPSFPTVGAIYSQLSTSSVKVYIGDPFASSLIANTASDGIVSTDLYLNSQLYDREYAWVNEDENSRIVPFENIQVFTPGQIPITAGGMTLEVGVYSRSDFDMNFITDINDMAVLTAAWLDDATQMTLPNNPVGWWKLEEGSGSTAYDSSGNNNTATLYNMDNSNWASGHDDGLALNFDGSSEYLRVADSASISVGASDYTLCAWIYPHTLSHRVGVITKTESNSNKEYAFYVDSGGRLVLEVEKDANDGISMTSSAVIQLNQWQHIMVTFDASTRTPTFFYNFQEVPGGSPLPALPTALNNDLYIGMWGQGYLTDRFDGIIDDVRIYNYAVQPKEVSAADIDGDRKVNLADWVQFSGDWMRDVRN